MLFAAASQSQRGLSGLRRLMGNQETHCFWLQIGAR
jgi:hypothetical protein